MDLEDHGRQRILTKVDVEPTGDAYNSIIQVKKILNALTMPSSIQGRSPLRV
jgi:glutaminase